MCQCSPKRQLLTVNFELRIPQLTISITNHNHIGPNAHSPLGAILIAGPNGLRGVISSYDTVVCWYDPDAPGYLQTYYPQLPKKTGPHGQMDTALLSGGRDSRFESWWGRLKLRILAKYFSHTSHYLLLLLRLSSNATYPTDLIEFIEQKYLASTSSALVTSSIVSQTITSSSKSIAIYRWRSSLRPPSLAISIPPIVFFGSSTSIR